MKIKFSKQSQAYWECYYGKTNIKTYFIFHIFYVLLFYNHPMFCKYCPWVIKSNFENRPMLQENRPRPRETKPVFKVVQCGKILSTVSKIKILKVVPILLSNYRLSCRYNIATNSVKYESFVVLFVLSGTMPIFRCTILVVQFFVILFELLKIPKI